MSLEGIRKKILGEAEKEKGKILAEAQVEAKKLASEAEKEVMRIRAQSQVEIEDKKKEIKERERIQTELRLRSNILKKKQELIDAVFGQALERLGALDLEAREKILEKYLQKARQEVGDKLVVQATHADQGLLQALLKKYPSFTLSGQEAAGQSGFLAESSEVEGDYRIENLIAEKREEHQAAVAQILFRS